LAVLAEPIVRLLYQHGKFTPHQTTVVAGALAAFAAGLTFNGTMLMLNRAFFSLQSNWIPTAVALANLALNAVLDAAFYRLGVWGIPLSTSFVNLAGTASLLVLLKRRIGPIGLSTIGAQTGRVLVASAGLAAVAYGAWRALDALLGGSIAAQIVSLGGAVVAGGAAYVAACKLVRVRELDSLLALRRS